MFPSLWVLLLTLLPAAARIILPEFRGRDGGVSFNRAAGGTVSQSGSVCVNGEIVDGKCKCHFDFVGKHCEREMHCNTFERKKDGSCTAGCVDGYSGAHCDEITCIRGIVDDWGTGCICNPPYQGRFCDELTTEKTYSFYNNKILQIGPLGALSIIPMSFIYWYFERNAKKRELTKLSESMEEQNIRVPNGRLEFLLKN